MKIGIDAFGIAVPELYLPIETLAVKRNIEVEKLQKGLGLERISLLDANQDVVSQAANAALDLIEKNNIDLTEISRIYVATESSVDNSKPIGSYVISLLEQKFGSRVLKNCDTVDFTFACIGGVDALLNCVDYIRLNPSEKAIIITTDKAKYDLESTGEYTQGAGAIALLISANPSIIYIESTIGVATEGVFDFFKPYHTISREKLETIDDLLQQEGILESEISMHQEQPVFDGQYSNECYINRITEAYNHFKSKKRSSEKPYETWFQIWMHLPYAFQGRRTFSSIFAAENSELLAQQTGENEKDKFRNFTKSEPYLNLVNEKLKPAEKVSGLIGNIYTGSIFLGMLGSLIEMSNQEKPEKIIGEKMGFIAYGSGSKSKVFEGIMQPNWIESIQKVNLTEKLKSAQAVDFDTYEKLHKKQVKSPINKAQKGFVLQKIENEIPTLKGARYYEYLD
uniref:hydroxymethylglutaryl-CoA synthase family protein n=1 Tax=Flavobacterium sp. TaxID=239 RepID=UPI00404AF0E1